MLKKHMVPLTPGGQTIKHAGKGSQAASMPNRAQINGLANGPGNTMNDYAKASPMPMPGAAPSGDNDLGG